MHIDDLSWQAAASRPDTAPTLGLVLMGGGARTAYQAGALRAIGQLLADSPPPSQ